MKNPSERGIIHDPKVDKTLFYSSVPPKEGESKEEENPITPIKSKKTETACREAELIGYRRGLKEGHRQGYEAGHTEGFDLGVKQGTAAVQNELKASLELFNTISTSLLSYKEDLFQQIKPELIRFALTVCETILKQELSTPKAFTALLEKIFQQAKSILKEVPIDIILAPDDLKMLKHNIKAVGYTKGELSKAHFIPDPQMKRGNCRMETSLGLINFDVNRLMQELEFKTLEA